MAKPTLSVYRGDFAVCRLDSNADVPAWAMRGDFFSVTRTVDELSILCPQSEVPEGVKHEGGWSALRVDGILDFALTGILAKILAPLADARISVFALSTFDTDLVLVRSSAFAAAIAALRSVGYTVRE